MVGHLKVGYFKTNILCAKVLLSAKSDGQGDLAEWSRRQPWDDSMKGRITRLQLSARDLHIVQSLSKKNIECTATVDE